jgi:hypothetical protein
VKNQGLLLVLLSMPALLAFGGLPQDEKGVPVFSGATLISEERSPAASNAGVTAEASFFLTRLYEAKASADDVMGFYVKSLGALPEEESGDPAPLRIWRAAEVDCMAVFYDAAFANQKGAAVTAGFAKRKMAPWASGLLTMGNLRWISRTTRGDEYSFTVTVEDKSVSDGQPPAYALKTAITVVVMMVNRGIFDAQQNETATQLAAAAQEMDDAANHQDPDMKRIVDEMTAHPPSYKDLSTLVSKEFGVPLYPKVTLELKAMELYTYDAWGDVGSYWFLSKDMPEKLIAFYEKATGNRAYQLPLGVAHFIDIKAKDDSITGCIIVYQGTTAAYLGQEADDATLEDAWLVSSLGFSRSNLRESEGNR